MPRTRVGRYALWIALLLLSDRDQLVRFIAKGRATVRPRGRRRLAGDATPVDRPRAGFDVRLNKRLSYRLSMDYDPTFLVRPVHRDPVLDSQGRLVLSQPTPSARARQDHARISMGIVWTCH